MAAAFFMLGLAGLLGAMCHRNFTGAFFVALAASTLQMPLVTVEGIDVKVSESIYAAFFLLFLPSAVLRADNGRLRLRAFRPDEVRIVVLLFALLVSFPARFADSLLSWDEVAYSLVHAARFSLLACALIVIVGCLDWRRRSDVPSLVAWVVLVSGVVAGIGYFTGLAVSVDPLNDVERARGTFINGNMLAAMHLCALPVVFGGIVVSQRKRSQVLLVCAAMSGVVALVLSESKMGIAVLGVNVLLLVLATARRPAALALLLVAGFVCVVLAIRWDVGSRFEKLLLAAFEGRVFATEEAARIHLWSVGLEAVSEYWILGSGFMSSRFVSHLDWSGRGFDTYHSFYLDFLSGAGVVPFALFLVYVALPVGRVVRSRRDPLSISAVVVVMNVMLMIFFENYLLSVFAHLFLALAIWLAGTDAALLDRSEERRLKVSESGDNRGAEQS